MKRIVEFSQKYQVNIRLAYYPPYHSKYNPIERTWAVLENHWNGSILDEIETALKFAQTMTWKGKHPIVKLITETYEKGVKLTKKPGKNRRKNRTSHRINESRLSRFGTMVY